ncbi:MAG: CDP-diacylglycerol--glycerol-3-phosphate 3-phosphatidyltransferase [Bacillales bacterium]|nr:CDP-diacylglycerol--glycerol-3-phosphate 3-phosphatidyltransferase [Bacillales bacterium]
MNLPNKISVSRILLIPFFVFIMLYDFNLGNLTILDKTLPINHLIGAFIFIFASATDWVDGYYARKYNLVTNLGKFLDPLADKLLVSAALIVLVELNFVASWIVILIISREFAITGLRLVLAGEGEVVAAGMLGKIKTWAQIVAISAYLLHNFPVSLINFPFDVISMYVALFFTLYSGFDYFVKNKHAFINSK